MNEEVLAFLGLRRLPGRLTSEQAAPLLGFAVHDIPVLVKARLLKPLGNPRQQAVKYFSSAEIEKCARDPDFLNRATKATYRYWENQNARRRSGHRTLKSEHLLAA